MREIMSGLDVELARGPKTRAEGRLIISEMVLTEISPALTRISHRFLLNGYKSWDENRL